MATCRIRICYLSHTMIACDTHPTRSECKKKSVEEQSNNDHRGRFYSSRLTLTNYKIQLKSLKYLPKNDLYSYYQANSENFQLGRTTGDV